MRYGKLYISGIENDELDLMPFEYLCFLISSKAFKDNYPYNILLKKDDINRLIVDSHVKCDFIYEGIRKDDILMVVGSVTPDGWTHSGTLTNRILTRLSPLEINEIQAAFVDVM